MSSDHPAPRVIRTGEGFWNIRGSFKLGGVVDLGTQASLVRRASGRFVLLDGCPLTDDARRWILELTDGGSAVEAILHVHPFHTLHVRRARELFPEAKLYGTARHVTMFEDLPWERPRTEDPGLHEMFADDLDFSVPRGVDFIPSNENLHFSSVLVFHRASRTLHVDDTLLYIPMPKPVRALKADVLRFHPTLSKVLERRAGAAEDFRRWARGLVAQARDVDNLCAAHSAALLGRDNPGSSVWARIEAALDKVEGTLRAHERAHG
ncbi:MAG: hypothetical protein ACOCUS_00205 [Polyangiales bacterium]